MNISKLVKTGLTVLAVSAISLSSALADVIWDYSPDTTNAEGSPNWSNISNGQNFADRVSFTETGALTGMDLYSGEVSGALDQIVRISIWEDNAGTLGNLITSFNEVVSVIDSLSTSTITYVTRKHVDFTNQFNFSVGSFWIGMTGEGSQLGQLGLSINTPGDSRMASFSGDTFTGMSDAVVGDMSFRLLGTFNDGNIDVPEPAPLALLGLGLMGLGLARRRRS
ncbi:PEP-CTERM sorting domain-containing protein [Paremcibacter congregatus]|uniref:Ice-binding protein C-terminal domain-containing protein n=1 Tax=Paremcibacter congregatus TaxID=2043170 RepID=A0A2G4YUE7_9PROT|nr:PEP-CTERM sorting domain-containing protein [Paremcibacter congregatus]PHZ85968.1 hypothetical protein CRD36_04660 [Paremcibacter congregatus]